MLWLISRFSVVFSANWIYFMDWFERIYFMVSLVFTPCSTVVFYAFALFITSTGFMNGLFG